MNLPAYSLLALCLLLLFSPSEVAAQESQKKNENLKFSCLYWEGAPPETLFYREGESFHPLEFSEAVRSKNFALKGMQSFELYRASKAPKEGEPPYDLLSKAALPSASQILFVIIPFEKKDQAIQYKVVAMDDTLEAFPRGTFRFANFTNQPLLVKFAGETGQIPPGQLTVMKCKAGSAGGFEPFMIGNMKGEIIFQTRLFGQPSGRELAFISPPLNEGAMPRVKYINQLVPPPLPKPTP